MLSFLYSVMICLVLDQCFSFTGTKKGSFCDLLLQHPGASKRTKLFPCDPGTESFWELQGELRDAKTRGLGEQNIEKIYIYIYLYESEEVLSLSIMHVFGTHGLVQL